MTRQRPLAPEWQELSNELARLHSAVESGEIELNQLATWFSEMAHAYHAAVLSAGKSSIRIRAMLKALDLTTSKSELTAFVGDYSGGPTFPLV